MGKMEGVFILNFSFISVCVTCLLLLIYRLVMGMGYPILLLCIFHNSFGGRRG